MLSFSCKRKDLADAISRLRRAKYHDDTDAYASMVRMEDSGNCHVTLTMACGPDSFASLRLSCSLGSSGAISVSARRMLEILREIGGKGAGKGDMVEVDDVGHRAMVTHTQSRLYQYLMTGVK